VVCWPARKKQARQDHCRQSEKKRAIVEGVENDSSAIHAKSQDHPQARLWNVKHDSPLKLDEGDLFDARAAKRSTARQRQLEITIRMKKMNCDAE